MEKNPVKRIAVLGAESTGKTWLCEALAAHYKTVWVPEYAREYFNDSDIYNYTLNDLVVIAKKQMEMEKEAVKNANGFLFCDTSLITLKIWAELEFKKTPGYISEALKKIKYDLYLLTNNDIEWTEDPLRQNKFSRDTILEMNTAEVSKIGTPHFLVRGTGHERLKDAIRIIDGS